MRVSAKSVAPELDWAMRKSGALVLGVGNLLMGDEGAGVHAIRFLEQHSWPKDVAFIDGGTTGFHLLSCFEDYDPIVMIDATMDGQLPGTVSLLEPEFASDFPRALTAHDIGLRDLIEAASLLRPLPKIFLITISIKELQSMSTNLSPEVRQSLESIPALICRHLPVVQSI